MASFFNSLKFWKSAETAQETAKAPEQEERSYTTPGITLCSWDASIGYGREVDRLSVVYGCIQRVGKTIASLPVQLNRRVKDGHEPATDHPYYRLLTRTPNKYQTNYTFWYTVMSKILLDGNCYVQMVKNGFGQVVELIPMNPNTVIIDILPDGTPLYKMTYAEPGNKSYYQEYTINDVIHFRDYTYTGVDGVSVIEKFKPLFDTYRALEDAGVGIARNAAKPNGIVYFPANAREEEVNKLKSQWSLAFTQGNSGKTAFVPNSYKIETPQTGLTAEEAQVVAQKEYLARRITADIYQVPTHMNGLNEHATFASVEQASLEFVIYTLRPLLVLLEQQLQKSLLGDDDDVYVCFDQTALLRGDINTRLNYYKMMVEHGAMTPNQVQAAENTGIVIPSQFGGNDYVRPVNFAKVDETQAAPTAESKTMQSTSSFSS